MYNFVTVFLCVLLLIGFHTSNCQQSDTLVLVIGTFRNGESTPGNTTYPTDPDINNPYLPYGREALTNTGIRTSVDLGQYLQRTYGNLLGNTYISNTVNGSSTDLNNTRTGLQLILSNLWPFPALQRIPYNIFSPSTLNILSYPPQTCPAFNPLYDSYMDTIDGRIVEMRYSYLYGYLQRSTGLNITSLRDLARLYFILSAENDSGTTLPVWVDLFTVFNPNVLRQAAIDFFRTSTATRQLRSLTGGLLLKQIVNDIQRKINNDTSMNNIKMIFYSGRAFNVAYELAALNVFVPHVPSYSACIMLELHLINGVYGIRIFYRQTPSNIVQPLIVPGCGGFCPFTQFLNLVQDNIPQSNNPCTFT